MMFNLESKERERERERVHPDAFEMTSDESGSHP